MTNALDTAAFVCALVSILAAVVSYSCAVSVKKGRTTLEAAAAEMTRLRALAMGVSDR